MNGLSLSFCSGLHQLGCVGKPLLGVLSALTLVSCQSDEGSGNLPPPRLPAMVAPEQAVVSQAFRVGDRLELLVEEDASFNANYEVREGGYILIPKVGRISVVGLNRDETEKRISEYLRKEQLKEAKVYVERRPGPATADGVGGVSAADPRLTVFVTGGVNRPGQHRVPLSQGRRAPGVYEVVLITGGLAKFGDETKVKIMRMDAQGVRRAITVNLRQIREGEIGDVPVGEGDIIEVPEKVFGF